MHGGKSKSNKMRHFERAFLSFECFDMMLNMIIAQWCAVRAAYAHGFVFSTQKSKCVEKDEIKALRDSRWLLQYLQIILLFFVSMNFPIYHCGDTTPTQINVLKQKIVPESIIFCKVI